MLSQIKQDSGYNSKQWKEDSLWDWKEWEQFMNTKMCDTCWQCHPFLIVYIICAWPESLNTFMYPINSHCPQWPFCQSAGQHQDKAKEIGQCAGNLLSFVFHAMTSQAVTTVVNCFCNSLRYSVYSEHAWNWVICMHLVIYMYTENTIFSSYYFFGWCIGGTERGTKTCTMKYC